MTFSDELDNAENYFTIQRCRFGDKISLELDLENERLLEVRMPKLILQPLVENAVSHGLEGKLGHGTVRIIVENSDRTFFLRVRDDGVGMPDEQVERLNAQFDGDGGADMPQPCGGSPCGMSTAASGSCSERTTACICSAPRASARSAA